MKITVPLTLALLFAAGVTPALAQTSQKSGDSYVYAPTTLGSRNPQPYVSEPIASLATGAQGDTERLNAVIQALNAETSLQGSKLTIAPDGEALLVTGVTVTRDQMKRAVEIATSQAGEGKVVNAIQTEELVIVENPAPSAPPAPQAAAADNPAQEGEIVPKEAPAASST